MALRSILNESTQQIEGFRSIDEIKRVLSVACQILRTDPSGKYKILSKIGQGAYGAVFKVQRYSD